MASNLSGRCKTKVVATSDRDEGLLTVIIPLRKKPKEPEPRNVVSVVMNSVDTKVIYDDPQPVLEDIKSHLEITIRQSGYTLKVKESPEYYRIFNSFDELVEVVLGLFLSVF